mgnify:CR=1 FL=1
MSVLIYIIRLSDRHKACPYESLVLEGAIKHEPIQMMRALFLVFRAPQETRAIEGKPQRGRRGC